MGSGNVDTNEPGVYINHVGYLCESRKRVIIEDGPWEYFEVQDMALIAKEGLGEYEQFTTVYKGKLKKFESPMGNHLRGNFSSVQTPGIYRVILPGDVGRSFQFIISDGAFSRLPRVFLDYIHNWRSGSYENDWRGPIHLDDGIRSDTGEQLDVSGGWYDAGDTRKWMTMSNLPVFAFFDLYERLNLKWNHFSEEEIADNDLITEAKWGIDFVLKMQDSKTGMFFEEVGAGGLGRAKEGMTWWYENHSGCLADNSDNRFTDNKPGSGDERTIRVEYNPVVQYINLAIVARSALVLKPILPDLAQECHNSALKAWRFVQNKKPSDHMHGWTVVRAWRLMAGHLLWKLGVVEDQELEQMADDLIELQDMQRGYWYMDIDKKEPYRGILHSAQALIALCGILEEFESNELAEKAKTSIVKLWEQYVVPMTQTNPFGIMPYGVFDERPTEGDLYHPVWGDQWFRFFLPDCSVQRINHGLAGHWTSWAHGLSYAGKLLNNVEMKDTALDQLNWEFGCNPLDSCLITGVGYNSPMPHSRFLGTFPGGFSVGPRGNADDQIVIDMNKRAEWSSTEYWNTPLSNTLMAFSLLLPESVRRDRKLGLKR